MNFHSDDNYNPRHNHQQQKRPDIKIRLIRPHTGSEMTVTVPDGTNPETILAAYPGWEFETT